jgi:hypothetical protein
MDEWGVVLKSRKPHHSKTFEDRGEMDIRVILVSFELTLYDEGIGDAIATWVGSVANLQIAISRNWLILLSHKLSVSLLLIAFLDKLLVESRQFIPNFS